MRSFSYYVLAGLLVLASVPIYRAILSHRVQADLVMTAPPRVAPDPPAFVDCSSQGSKCAALVNIANAMAAIRTGRAKCVAGVVYRTADHVIEPWPGNVACDDPYAFRGPRGV